MEGLWGFKMSTQVNFVYICIYTYRYAHKGLSSIYVTCGTQAKQKHICGKSKAEAHKSFFLFCILVWRSPRYRHTSMCRRPSRPCHHSANDVLCGPIPVNKLSSHKTRLPIYRLSSSRFRLSYSKVRQKAFSDFVQFRHTQSLLHMWDELTANISMNPFRAA